MLLKIKGNPVPELWGRGLIVPASGYLEVHGPWPVEAAEWIELNPIVVIYSGRLIGSKCDDKLIDITSALQRIEMNYAIVAEFVRVFLSEKSFVS